MTVAGAQLPADIARLPAFDAGIEDEAVARERCASFRAVAERLRAAVGKRLVGQQGVVDQTLWALFAGGHVLLEGVPGLGKTLLVRTLGECLRLDFSRIQFTPDLMPADITGTTLFVVDERTGRREFTFRPGPIFTQLLLADEINRATPKSQSALLEAMQERSVTVGGVTHRLARPFLVMATQNPIEQEGTYPLPQAQLDRFLLKITVPAAKRDDLNEILRRTTGGAMASARSLLDADRIQAAQRLARRIVIAPHVQDYLVRLVLATHPDGERCPEDLRNYIRTGASPRAAQALATTGRIVALMDGRYAVGFDDLRKVALPVLRHRIERTFEAEADGLSTDDLVRTILERTPTLEPAAGGRA